MTVASRSNLSLNVPAGRLKVARHFSAGYRAKKAPRPVGTLELSTSRARRECYASYMSAFEALQQLRLPDAWQAEAIRALATGDDVIVQAPTGAGKTFIFEQYFQQRRGPGQVIFTVPTRALANDKFAEWTRQGWRVGITTGDLAYQADAPLVVATLEAQQTPTNVALYVVD